MNVNKVHVLGRITRDIELKSLPSGQAVASFSLATNHYYKDGKTGDRKEEVEFHNLTAFGKGAETLAQYVKKGSSLYVEGRLKTRTWDDKESGKKMYRTEIIVDTFQLPPKSAGSSPSEEGGSQVWERPAAKKAPVKKQESMDTVEYPVEDINPEDIPF